MKSIIRAVFVALAVLTGHVLAQCPPDYVPYDTHCYRVILIGHIYKDADGICQNSSPGARLASIHSQEENAFIQSILNDDAWIGYDDLTQEGTFAWSDGSAGVYENWSNGQPDNGGVSGNDQDCAEITVQGVWTDVECDTTLHQSICKVPIAL